MSGAADTKGLKRICPDCGTRFYDLNKRPIICPASDCKAEFTGEIKLKSRRGRAALIEAAEKPTKAKASKAVANDVNDDEDFEDANEDEDIISLEDVEEIDDADEDDLDVGLDDEELEDLDDEDLEGLDDLDVGLDDEDDLEDEFDVQKDSDE